MAKECEHYWRERKKCRMMTKAWEQTRTKKIMGKQGWCNMWCHSQNKGDTSQEGNKENSITQGESIKQIERTAEMDGQLRLSSIRAKSIWMQEDENMCRIIVEL